MTNMIVAKDYFENIDPEQIRSILKESPYNKALISSSASFVQFLRYYIVLTWGRKSIPAIPDDVWYTSRYYYLKLYYHFHSRKLGEDAGIEQQMGKLIEEMSHHLELYDWNILENISKEIAKIEIVP